MKPVNELVLQQLAMQCDNDKSFTIKNEIDYIKNFAGKIVSNTQVVTCIDTLVIHNNNIKKKKWRNHNHFWFIYFNFLSFP